MKVGQLVRYRSWREGDKPVESVEPRARGWDRSGIVLRLCDWSIAGVVEAGCGVEYLSEDGAIILAHKDDLVRVEKGARGSD